MHEMALVNSLLAVAEQEARTHRATRIRRLVCTMGCLRAIDGQFVKDAFGIARADTLARDAELEIQLGAVVLDCRECGHQSREEHLRFDCPKCGSPNVEISGGEELELTSLELELSDAH